MLEIAAVAVATVVSDAVDALSGTHRSGRCGSGWSKNGASRSRSNAFNARIRFIFCSGPSKREFAINGQ